MPTLFVGQSMENIQNAQTTLQHPEQPRTSSPSRSKTTSASPTRSEPTFSASPPGWRSRRRTIDKPHYTPPFSSRASIWVQSGPAPDEAFYKGPNTQFAGVSSFSGNSADDQSNWAHTRSPGSDFSPF
jgi:hypothetical protein